MRSTTRPRDREIDHTQPIVVDEKRILVISIDTNELYSDDGYVEEEVLNAVSKAIEKTDHDLPLLITHYSILGTDECPLKNSAVLINFVQKHRIEYVFCGHTHELELMRTTDLYHRHTFTHFMCGTLSSRNHPKDDNMFLFYENFGTKDMQLHVIRVLQSMNTLRFEEEMI